MTTHFLRLPRRRIFFFDEGRFGLHTERGRCWALRGVQPYAPVALGYENFYCYAAVSPYGGDSFMLFLPWANTEMMNLYLQHFARAYPHDEVLVLLDRAGWHTAKALLVPPNLSLQCLPPYSPELNPVEKLWWWLRRDVCRNRLFSSDQELQEALAHAIQGRTPSELATLCHCSYLDNVK